MKECFIVLLLQSGGVCSRGVLSSTSEVHAIVREVKTLATSLSGSGPFSFVTKVRDLLHLSLALLAVRSSLFQLVEVVWSEVNLDWEHRRYDAGGSVKAANFVDCVKHKRACGIRKASR